MVDHFIGSQPVHGRMVIIVVYASVRPLLVMRVDHKLVHVLVVARVLALALLLRGQEPFKPPTTLTVQDFVILERPPIDLAMSNQKKLPLWPFL
jgi:hypothetical protein